MDEANENRTITEFGVQSDNKPREAQVIWVFPDGRMTDSPSQAMAWQLDSALTHPQMEHFQNQLDEAKSAINEIRDGDARIDELNTDRSRMAMEKHNILVGRVRDLEKKVGWVQDTTGEATERIENKTTELKAMVKDLSRGLGVVRARFEMTGAEDSPWADDEGSFADWLMAQLSKIDQRFSDLEAVKRWPDFTKRLRAIEDRMDGLEKRRPELSPRGRLADVERRVRELDDLNIHRNMASLGRRLADIERANGIEPKYHEDAEAMPIEKRSKAYERGLRLGAERAIAQAERGLRLWYIARPTRFSQVTLEEIIQAMKATQPVVWLREDEAVRDQLSADVINAARRDALSEAADRVVAYLTKMHVTNGVIEDVRKLIVDGPR